MRHWAILNFELRQIENAHRTTFYSLLRAHEWQQINDLSTIWTKVYSSDESAFVREAATREIKTILDEVGILQPHYQGFLAISCVEPYDF